MLIGGGGVSRAAVQEEELSNRKSFQREQQAMREAAETLKVPKCENFHRTDFFYFFTIEPLWVGDFRAKIKNSKF
jgi:hypothetical protein